MFAEFERKVQEQAQAAQAAPTQPTPAAPATATPTPSAAPSAGERPAPPQRQSKPAQAAQPAETPRPQAGASLPTVAEILSFANLGPSATAPAPTAAATDSKPDERTARAANSDR
jgi:hypothetical protein